MMRIFYDCEILKCIPPVIDLSYNYCDGWQDFEGMGLACLCAVSDDGEAFVYTDIGIGMPLAESQKLFLEAEQAVGFNNLAFDNRLLAVHEIVVYNAIDLLLACRLSAYGSPDYKDQPEGHCYKLQSIAKANGYSKTGTGESAPMLWQQGEYGKVIDYCLNDCVITKELTTLFYQGKLINPNTGDYFSLE